MLTTRNNIAAWTGRTGEAWEASRLYKELLPDHEQLSDIMREEQKTRPVNQEHSGRRRFGRLHRILAGCSGHIHKPYQPEELLEAVRSQA